MFGWIKKNWKTIATVAVATVAFVAVTALTGGLGAAPMLALLAGGVASGVAGSVTADLLEGRPVNVQGALVNGAVAGVVTVATAGLGRVFAPYVSRAVTPVLTRVSPRLATPFVTNTITNTTVGSTLGAGTQVTTNWILDRPLDENLGRATLVGGAGGLLMEPLRRVLPQPRNGNYVHLTNDRGAAGINASGTINGPKGIFVIGESAAKQPVWVRVLRTGVTPDKARNVVPIPEGANVHLESVVPIGPYSLIKNLGGVRFAPPGSINLQTGVFTPANGSILGPRALVYGPDALVYATGLGVVATVKGIASATQPAPPPKSKGMLKALGEASDTE